jgi:hypothetical protein
MLRTDTLGLQTFATESKLDNSLSGQGELPDFKLQLHWKTREAGELSEWNSLGLRDEASVDVRFDVSVEPRVVVSEVVRFVSVVLRVVSVDLKVAVSIILRIDVSIGLMVELIVGLRVVVPIDQRVNVSVVLRIDVSNRSRELTVGLGGYISIGLMVELTVALRTEVSVDFHGYCISGSHGVDLYPTGYLRADAGCCCVYSEVVAMRRKEI